MRLIPAAYKTYRLSDYLSGLEIRFIFYQFGGWCKKKNTKKYRKLFVLAFVQPYKKYNRLRLLIQRLNHCYPYNIMSETWRNI